MDDLVDDSDEHEQEKRSQLPPSPQGTHPSLPWRIFFGLNCFFIVLNILSVPFMASIGILEVIDFTFTNLTFVGLCGFILQKPLGSVVFWRYYFYAALLEGIVVLLLFPLFDVKLYGDPMNLNILLLNIANTIGNLAALNLYAYKQQLNWSH